MTFISQDTTFEALIPAILRWEGGKKLVDHPRDPGGKTKYGISERFNADALKRLKTTIKDLTEDQARQIYFEDYYCKSGCTDLEDIGLVLVHFDAAVNHGVGAACAILAQLPANPHNYAGNGMNKAIFNELSMAYLGARVRRYDRDPNQNVFLQGWDERLALLIDAHVQLFLKPGCTLS